MLYPITFSIPSEKIVQQIPPKTRMLAHLNPRDKSTYIYTTEESYYAAYQESYFARTCKQAGWDCMRHYEIMANGCIPVFENIENCPESTMAYLPKDLFHRATTLYQEIGHLSIEALTQEQINACQELTNLFLEFLRTRLTTTCIAQKILENVNATGAQKILYLSGCLYPDYLRCLTLHGFKSLLGIECHDFPKIPHLYKEHTIPQPFLYGKGFTYSALIDPSLHNDNADATVEDDIRNHVYDLIIYGSYHRGLPLYPLVRESYEPSHVIFLCGEDIHNCTYSDMTDQGHYVFVRELT